MFLMCRCGDVWEEKIVPAGGGGEGGRGGGGAAAAISQRQYFRSFMRTNACCDNKKKGGLRAESTSRFDIFSYIYIIQTRHIQEVPG